jgi:predicted RNase H-like nuclease (RuvC/YqgF family)
MLHGRLPARILALLLALIASLGATACAEGGADPKTASAIEEAHVALARKEVEIRAYQWQLATLGQQLREGQARSDALQRDLYAQVRELAAANAALTERLKRAESDRAVLASAPPEGGKRDERTSDRSIAELRRALAAEGAHNAQIAEELARIARILGSRPPPPDAPAKGPATIDVVDPWGFGSRK